MRTVPSKIALGLLQLATATLLASACSSEVTGLSQPDNSVDMIPADSAVAYGQRMG